MKKFSVFTLVTLSVWGAVGLQGCKQPKSIDGSEMKATLKDIEKKDQFEPSFAGMPIHNAVSGIREYCIALTPGSNKFNNITSEIVDKDNLYSADRIRSFSTFDSPKDKDSNFLPQCSASVFYEFLIKVTASPGGTPMTAQNCEELSKGKCEWWFDESVTISRFSKQTFVDSAIRNARVVTVKGVDLDGGIRDTTSVFAAYCAVKNTKTDKDYVIRATPCNLSQLKK